MRILQANKAYFPVVGGIETTVTNLSEGLSRREGFSVGVLTCNGERSSRAVRKDLNGVDVTYVPAWGSIASLPISPAYARFLAGMKADILHVHEPFPLVDMAMLAFPGIAANFAHIVVSWHGDIVRQRWALPLYRPMIHRFLRKVGTILVSAPELIEVSEYLPLYRDQCRVIPHGVNLDWVGSSHLRRGRVEEIRKERGTPLVLFVGRLVYYKGLRYLMEAMSLTPAASLVIIGSGPLGDEIAGDIAGFGLGEGSLSSRMFPRRNFIHTMKPATFSCSPRRNGAKRTVSSRLRQWHAASRSYPRGSGRE